jgi:hypothetical protein
VLLFLSPFSLCIDIHILVSVLVLPSLSLPNESRGLMSGDLHKIKDMMSSGEKGDDGMVASSPDFFD